MVQSDGATVQSDGAEVRTDDSRHRYAEIRDRRTPTVAPSYRTFALRTIAPSDRMYLDPLLRLQKRCGTGRWLDPLVILEDRG